MFGRIAGTSRGDEFQAVHDLERARRVRPVHAAISAAELQPRFIVAVERGMEPAAGVDPRG